MASLGQPPRRFTIRVAATSPGDVCLRFVKNSSDVSPNRKNLARAVSSESCKRLFRSRDASQLAPPLPS
jgi:hypothetical protein